MLIIREKGLCDYINISHQMQNFTKQRQADTDDECWLLEHFPVFTQGTNCQLFPKIASNNTIPVVQSNRGGQITYHAPGQLIVYCLLDLKRLGIGVRALVEKCQHLIIEWLNKYAIEAHTKPSFPGVYVDNKKIAALGFRISRGYCYHGFAINLNMDLTPFEWIAPCGYEWLKITQLSNYVDNVSTAKVNKEIKTLLQQHFSITAATPKC